MSEEDRIDALLRQAMAVTRSPSLSSDFEARLSRRLRSVQPSPRRRAGVTAYAVAAAIVSVWLMRKAAIDWPLVVVALSLPITIAAVAYGRYVTPYVRL